MCFVYQWYRTHVALVLLAVLCCVMRVENRSYNNGLIFYDLQTHIAHLPPTISVSRGRDLAQKKYSEKGSIWSHFGQPCECKGMLCGCCTGIKIKQYHYDQKMCANVTYVAPKEEALLEVYLNEKPSSRYGLSTRNPSPFCIPVMMGVPMAMCVQMSNIAVQGNNLNMCMDFVVRLATTDLFEMHFQCMKMGLDGLMYVDKNGQPVVPPSQSKTQAPGAAYEEYYDGTGEGETAEYEADVSGKVSDIDKIDHNRNEYDDSYEDSNNNYANENENEYENENEIYNSDVANEDEYVNEAHAPFVSIDEKVEPTNDTVKGQSNEKDEPIEGAELAEGEADADEKLITTPKTVDVEQEEETTTASKAEEKHENTATTTTTTEVPSDTWADAMDAGKVTAIPGGPNAIYNDFTVVVPDDDEDSDSDGDTGVKYNAATVPTIPTTTTTSTTTTTEAPSTAVVDDDVNAVNDSYNPNNDYNYDEVAGEEPLRSPNTAGGASEDADIAADAYAVDRIDNLSHTQKDDEDVGATLVATQSSEVAQLPPITEINLDAVASATEAIQSAAPMEAAAEYATNLTGPGGVAGINNATAAAPAIDTLEAATAKATTTTTTTAEAPSSTQAPQAHLPRRFYRRRSYG